MATETLEKKMYHCEAASLEELDRLLMGTYAGRYSGDSLRACVAPEVPGNIDWRHLRHIRVFGGDGMDTGRIERFTARLPQGFYLNADGTWLLMILPEKPRLEVYFNQYGENAESLWIFDSRMYIQDVRRLPELKELYLQNVMLMDSLYTLDRLKQLKTLSVVSCPVWKTSSS